MHSGIIIKNTWLGSIFILFWERERDKEVGREKERWGERKKGEERERERDASA